MIGNVKIGFLFMFIIFSYGKRASFILSLNYSKPNRYRNPCNPGPDGYIAASGRTGNLLRVHMEYRNSFFSIGTPDVYHLTLNLAPEKN